MNKNNFIFPSLIPFNLINFFFIHIKKKIYEEYMKKERKKNTKNTRKFFYFKLHILSLLFISNYSFRP